VRLQALVYLVPDAIGGGLQEELVRRPREVGRATPQQGTLSLEDLSQDIHKGGDDRLSMSPPKRL